MPIVRNFALPGSIKSLQKPASSGSAFFIAFIASKDPTTGQPWCPDVAAALPKLEAAFSSDSAPTVAFVEVGQKPEWKDAQNVFRTTWNVNSIPTLVRYEGQAGEVGEKGRLVEGEILDGKRLQQLAGGQ